MKFLSVAVFVMGIILLNTSYRYDRYTNEKEYNEEYYTLSGGKEDSEKFYQLRDEYLTPKFDLENYGITLIQVGVIFLLVAFIGLRNLRTPKKKFWILFIGIVAALLTSVGTVGDLFLEMERDSYPHWADSLAIPLMGVPFMLLIFIVWAIVNYSGTSGRFRTGVNIVPIKFDYLDYWYAIVLGIAIIIEIIIIGSGQFWQVTSGFLWIYFYLSIMLGRQKARVEQI